MVSNIEQDKAQDEVNETKEKFELVKADMEELAKKHDVCFAAAIHMNEDDVTGFYGANIKSSLEHMGLIKAFVDGFKDA